MAPKRSTHISELLALDAALVEEALDALQSGADLMKVKSFSSWYRRRYVFEKENRRIVYEGSRKLPCLKASEIIDIREIHDIRKGWKTDRFNKIAFKVARQKQKRPGKASPVEESCCFSVVYGPEHLTLDLICPDENTCNKWVRGLSHLIALQKSIERDQALNNWLKEQFRKADEDQSGGLNFDECMTVLNQLNIEMSEEHAVTIFDEANTNKMKRNDEDVLDEIEFVNFYLLLKKRPELEALFNSFSAGAHVWGPNNMVAFLEKEQKMKNVTYDDACDLIDIYEQSQNKEDGLFSIEGFRKLLQSDVMDIFNVNHRSVYQDMNQPLSHYFIASSHNTYLIADQIAGESSVEGYIRAFEAGCRCVELDMWDGPDDEPIVYHGYTLTTKILLKDIITDAIKPYAFARSEFPVILSLENHLSVEQQKIAANHFTTILGDFLYTMPVSSDLTAFPSPQFLKRKIILKNKKLSENRIEVPKQEEVSTSDAEDENGKKQKVGLAQELSDLVNICKAVHFDGFEESEEDGVVCKVSSFSEGKALRLANQNTSDFIRYNQRFLSRIYPSGTRQGSSNFDPIPYWNVGCQLVSLNYQTWDVSTMLNQAKFQDNGKCGYVLKPQYLRKGDPRKMAYGVSPMIKTTTKWTIKIISGQCIPKPHQATTGEVIDPYVIINIYGHEEDVQQVKTKHVPNNGFNPVWDEMFELEINYPDLALVHFLVKDYSSFGKDEMLGEFALSFTNVQQGYRHIHLKDEQNRAMIPTSVFVHSSIQ